MTLSLVRKWVESTVRHPNARARALSIVEQAAHQRVDATLVVGRELTRNHRCYLARWDGVELVVLELTQPQQRCWKIAPGGLVVEVGSPSMSGPVEEVESCVSLAIGAIDPASADWPLTGTFRFEMEGPLHTVIENSALRARYFRPDLPFRVATTCYLRDALRPPGGEMRFRFDPIGEHLQPPLAGPLAVFLQLLTAEDWAAQRRERKVSNVASALVDLQ